LGQKGGTIKADNPLLISAKKTAVSDQGYLEKALFDKTFYSAKRLRPFFLRLFKTFLPPTVAVLALKPCLFLLFLLLG
tara:strand:+ start:239 stop:472 length:234 start_codon:yes stop_codon:yes gene_type:complete